MPGGRKISINVSSYPQPGTKQKAWGEPGLGEGHRKPGIQVLLQGSRQGVPSPPTPASLLLFLSVNVSYFVGFGAFFLINKGCLKPLIFWLSFETAQKSPPPLVSQRQEH